MTTHDKNLPKEAKAILAAARHLQTKDAGDPFEILTKKLGDLTDETLRRIGKTDQDIAVVNETMRNIDQKMARVSFGGGPIVPETWGKQFIDAQSESVKALAESNKGAVSFNLKAVTTGATSGGPMDVPARDSASALLPKRRLTIRDLMPVISISSGSVEYVQQDTRPEGAAPVAEGALKPESDMTLSLKTTSAKVIAHWIKASRQVLDDSPQLSDLIDTEMRYGLALAEEGQILNGDGTGSNLDGLITNATAFSDPLSMATPTMLDLIGSAILQSALADFPADGIVIHPADWTRMRLLKDADGRYILGDPAAEIAPRLFGLPVVPTKAMAVDKFMVGSFNDAATLYDRWQPRVEVGYVNDDFVRNMVTVLAEERLAMAVKQPLALTYGDFGNIT